MARGRPKAAGGKNGKNGIGGQLGFEAELFLAADKLRKNLEPSDYKHVVLGLIFLRHISLAFEAKREALLTEDPAAAEDADEYLAENIFWVPKEARWSHLQANARQPTIGKLIDDAMSAIEAANSSLKGVLPKDYNRPALINGEVRSQAQRNVTQSRGFTERLEAAIARYHANAITTVQVLEELIRLAKDIRAARARGEETGLSDEEIAFYDALAQNESAQEVMGEPALRVIAHELVTSLRSSITVDWMHREAARARVRVLVKRILRKYGYPPDLQDAAVQTVLQQAEALSAEWARAA